MASEPRDPNSRDAVVERVMARTSFVPGEDGSAMGGTRDIPQLNRWGGGGGYFYEITDEGIKVTGDPMGGKEVVLSWDDRDPKNLQMIDAILLERGGQDSELGATYSPAASAEPEPERPSEANVMAAKSSEGAQEARGEMNEVLSERAEEGIPLERGDAPEPSLWPEQQEGQDNAKLSLKERRIQAAERALEEARASAEEERVPAPIRALPVYNTKTGDMRASRQYERFPDDLDG